jgi:hypothetical protein
MPQDLFRQMRELQERASTAKLKAQEEKIKRIIVRKIIALQKRVSALQKEVVALDKKCKHLHAKGKGLQLIYFSWKLRKKKKKLENMKKMTPSPRLMK